MDLRVMVGILACGWVDILDWVSLLRFAIFQQRNFKDPSNSQAFCALFIDSNGLGMDVSTKGFWVHRESGVAAALPLG